MTQLRALSFVAAICCASAAASVRADSVSIIADSDNTLFEDIAGSISNGAGEYLFSGLTLQPALRRALLRFDVAGPGGVPTGATITSATLTLFQSRGGSSPYSMSFHRVLSNWGEGASDAPLEEGTGIAAEPGDATWLHSSFPGTLWTTPGGDFAAAPSTTAAIGGYGSWSWPTTPQLVADIQQMLDQPELNFGWALIGEELFIPPTAKRFNSREHAELATRPTLTITYEIPAPALGAWVGAIFALAIRRRRVAIAT